MGSDFQTVFNQIFQQIERAENCLGKGSKNAFVLI